jgi:nitronate monooxygenase
LSIAVANAGGLGACGALLMPPEEIMHWAATVRASSNGGFQLNLWIPDPPPIRDVAHEKKVRSFLAGWGPEVPPSAGDPALPNFSAQCDALLEASPRAVSSVMGVYPRASTSRG